MLKNILKTNGAQELSKNELQTINGGNTGSRKCAPPSFKMCAVGYCCTTTTSQCVIGPDPRCL